MSRSFDTFFAYYLLPTLCHGLKYENNALLSHMHVALQSFTMAHLTVGWYRLMRILKINISLKKHLSVKRIESKCINVEPSSHAPEESDILSRYKTNYCMKHIITYNLNNLPH